MQYNLFEFFGSLSDPRRGQGQRHKFKDILSIIIMAILSGHQGIRGFTRFAKANSAELTEVFQLKYGVPGYSTFRSFIIDVNDQVLASKFIEWVKHAAPDHADEVIALDGKAVKASISGGQTSAQNFVSVVNAFGHSSNIVYGMKAFENAKSGEAQALRDLITQLGLKGKLFTMDALHAQKKHLT